MAEKKVIIKYQVPTQFLIGERETKIIVSEGQTIGEALEKLLLQPFTLRVLFPDSRQIHFNKILPEKGPRSEQSVEFSTEMIGLPDERVEWLLEMFYMIEGKLSRTKTGLPPLVLTGLTRGEVWQIIGSELFKEYIYLEMGTRLPPNPNRYCVKLVELSLEYGELLFSLQLL